MKPKLFKNLDEMAREADLFTEARAAYKNKSTSTFEPSMWGNKPEIKCRIFGKTHLTYKCLNNPDWKGASSTKYS